MMLQLTTLPSVAEQAAIINFTTNPQIPPITAQIPNTGL